VIEEQGVQFDEEQAPLELGIQLMETMDAPGWGTAAGVVVSMSLVGGAAYT
jgi:hypothetical protein